MTVGAAKSSFFLFLSFSCYVDTDNEFNHAPPPFPRLPTKERERKRERGQSQLSDEQSSNKPCSVTHVGPIEILVYITAHRCCWAECILWVIRINTKWQHDSSTYKISLYFTVLWSQLKIFFLVCYFDSGSHSGSNPVLFGTVPYLLY